MGGQGRRMEAEEAVVTATPVATPERVTIAGGPGVRECESYKDVAMHGKKRYQPLFPRGQGARPQRRSAPRSRRGRRCARARASAAPPPRHQ
jgi:hypothetical protein